MNKELQDKMVSCFELAEQGSGEIIRIINRLVNERRDSYVESMTHHAESDEDEPQQAAIDEDDMTFFE